MNKKLVSLVFLTTLLQPTLIKPSAYSQNSMLFGMTVQFPQTLTSIPEMRAYCGGRIIKGCINNTINKLFFSIPTEKYTSTFTLLIAHPDAIGCITQENTVQHLTLDTTHPYKLYTLRLKEHVIPNPQPLSGKEPRTEFIWEIQPLTLKPNSNGTIPDSTIILCYNPEYIAKLDGGNAVELPTIYIKDNILNLVGSEAQLHEQSIELLLASLDYDALHASIKHCIKPCYTSKTVLTLIT